MKNTLFKFCLILLICLSFSEVVFAAEINEPILITENTLTVKINTNYTNINLEIYDQEKKRIIGPKKIDGDPTEITAIIDIKNLIRGITYTLKVEDRESIDRVNFNTSEIDTRTTSAGDWYYSSNTEINSFYGIKDSKAYHQFTSNKECNDSFNNTLRKAFIGSTMNHYEFTPCFELNTKPSKDDFIKKMIDYRELKVEKPVYFFEFWDVLKTDNFGLSDGFDNEKDCISGSNFSGYIGKIMVECFPSQEIPKKPLIWDSTNSHSVGISPIPKKEDNTYHLLAPIPGMKDDFVDGSQQIGDYINNMFKIFLGLCAALAVIMIIIYGVTWMGTDSVFGKTEAKSKIGGAIGGLLLALGAWVILNTINPDLLGGTLNIKQASIELDGDVAAPVSINSGDATKIGLKCDNTGGKDAISATANSFNGRMTYSQEIPKGKVVNNKIQLDCSGYVNYVLQCVGIDTKKLGINSDTKLIFSNAKKVDTTKTTATSINGEDLKAGDLVGWRAGDNTGRYSKGHVMIYIGGGLVSDSHSGDSNAFGSFALTRYKDQIKFVKRL